MHYQINSSWKIYLDSLIHTLLSYMTHMHIKTGRYTWNKLVKVFLKLLHIHRLTSLHGQCSELNHQSAFTGKTSLRAIEMVVDAHFLKCSTTVSRISSQTTVALCKFLPQGNINGLLTKNLRHCSHGIGITTKSAPTGNDNDITAAVWTTARMRRRGWQNAPPL